MRRARLLVCAVLLINPSAVVFAQQPAVASSQASALLEQSLRALTGSRAITDVTLTATARRIVGSDDETGSATIKAVASGASRVDLSFASGDRSETLNLTTNRAAGSWSGPDGKSHPIAFHNLLSGPFWFLPSFALSASASAHGAVVANASSEERSGRTVEHLTITQTSTVANSPIHPSSSPLTQLDFFIDPSTNLPVSLEFSIHPDENELLAIPVEIRFSDYRPIDGTQVPYHIQKFVNNTLTLDLEIQSAHLNSGLSAASFTQQ
jgi:hypothetical protein